MAWPTDDLTNAHLDAGGDDPSQARAELNALLLKVQEILAEVADGEDVWHTGNDSALGILARTGLWTRQQNFQASALSFGANVSWNLATAQSARLTLSGNATLDNPSSMVNGGTYILKVQQDGTGGRSLNWGSAYKWPGGNAPTVSTDPNAVDLFFFYSDGVDMLGTALQDFS